MVTKVAGGRREPARGLTAAPLGFRERIPSWTVFAPLPRWSSALLEGAAFLTGRDTGGRGD